MGTTTQQTVNEIEETREDLARKVDLLVDRAKVEAAAAGKKMAVAGLVIAGILVLGIIAKKRVQA